MKKMTEGYDVKVVENALSDMYCVICLKLMRKPVQFRCSHGMCKSCFETLLNANGKKTKKKCPVCRKKINSNQVNENEMLHRIILGVKVKCSNEDNGCSWIGELQNLQKHIDSDCDYTVILCSYNNCQQKVQRMDVADHEISCNWRILNCKYCKENYVFTNEKHHSICVYYPIICPTGCGKNIQSNKLTDHEMVCESRVITCPYEHCGCTVKVSWANLSKHLVEAVQYHGLSSSTSLLIVQKKTNEKFQSLRDHIEDKFIDIGSMLKCMEEKLNIKTEQITEKYLERPGDMAEPNNSLSEQTIDICQKSLEITTKISDQCYKINEQDKDIQSFNGEVIEAIKVFDIKAKAKGCLKHFPEFMQHIQNSMQKMKNRMKKLKLSNTNMSQDIVGILSNVEHVSNKQDLVNINQQLQTNLEKVQTDGARLDEMSVHLSTYMSACIYKTRFAFIVNDIVCREFENGSYIWKIDASLLAGTKNMNYYWKSVDDFNAGAYLSICNNHKIDVEHRLWSQASWINIVVEMLNQSEPGTLSPDIAAYICKLTVGASVNATLYSMSAMFPSLFSLPHGYYVNNTIFINIRVVEVI